MNEGTLDFLIGIQDIPIRKDFAWRICREPVDISLFHFKNSKKSNTEHQAGQDLTLKALGIFLPVQHWGVGGVLAYVMFYKICKFESLTITNDVNHRKQWQISYLTLTSIKFDPDNQEI